MRTVSEKPIVLIMSGLPPELNFKVKDLLSEHVLSSESVSENRCFLHGGMQKCRGCYHGGFCDAQDEHCEK